MPNVYWVSLCRTTQNTWMGSSRRRSCTTSSWPTLRQTSWLATMWVWMTIFKCMVQLEFKWRLSFSWQNSNKGCQSVCKHIYWLPIVGQLTNNFYVMAGSRHRGGRKDHIGWVLGLLQRHLCLHRPGRLLRPHGQKRLETLDQWILLLNLHCALKLISSEKSPLSYSCLMMSLWSQLPYQEFC